MEVKDNMVVGMHYTLKNDAGEVIDSSEGQEPLLFLQGHGNIISGLESALNGKTIGDKLDVTVEPEDAYGIRHEEAIQELPMSAFEGVGELTVGMMLQAQTEHGPMPITITSIDGDKVTIDGNHQLAGERLHFNVSIESVREATEEEIEHGHVHDGHSHH